MPSRLLQSLAIGTVIALTVMLTAGLLYGLLWRLGDEAGAAWAGRIAVLAAGAVVAATAVTCLPSLIRQDDRRP